MSIYKDASRTLRLISARRRRRKVMSEPRTMPLVAGSASRTSRYLASFRRRHFYGTATTRPGETSSNPTSGESSSRRSCRSPVAHDYLRHGDFSPAIRSSSAGKNETAPDATGQRPRSTCLASRRETPCSLAESETAPYPACLPKRK